MAAKKGELLGYLEELQRYPWVSIRASPENVGIIAGLRLCLEHARGRYILPVDADDWLYPDCLEVVSWWVRETGFPPLLYSDEDKRIDTRGGSAVFKTGFRSGFAAQLGIHCTSGSDRSRHGARGGRLFG